MAIIGISNQNSRANRERKLVHLFSYYKMFLFLSVFLFLFLFICSFSLFCWSFVSLFVLHFLRSPPLSWHSNGRSNVSLLSITTINVARYHFLFGFFVCLRRHHRSKLIKCVLSSPNAMVVAKLIFYWIPKMIN